jgi:hypothetical protein
MGSSLFSISKRSELRAAHLVRHSGIVEVTCGYIDEIHLAREIWEEGVRPNVHLCQVNKAIQGFGSGQGVLN